MTSEWARRLEPILSDGMRSVWQHPAGVRIVFDHLNPTSRGLEAWVEVRWMGETPPPTLLTFGRFDLRGSRTVTALARAAAADCPRLAEDTEAALRSMIRAAVYSTVSDFDAGEPSVPLSDVLPTRRRWLLRPLVETAGHTRLIAPGGSAKSLLALTVAWTVATGRAKLLGAKPDESGPVLYLDWEADAETHAERLRALCKPHGLPIPDTLLYQQHRFPLVRNYRSVARTVRDEHVVMLVVDSNALARGGSGDRGAEDSTIRMFAALREIGVPALIIDHKSDEKMRTGRRGGYGSVFNTNSVRLEWEVIRQTQTADDIAIVLSLSKKNNVSPQHDLGFRFTFTSDDDSLQEIRVQPVDPQSVHPLAHLEERPSRLVDRIAALLLASDEPLSVSEIAAQVDASEASIRAQLARHHDRFVKVKSGRQTLWRVAGEPRDDGNQDELPDPF